MERHFKGHRDVVTSVDFNPNMKQIGRSLTNATNSISICWFDFNCPTGQCKLLPSKLNAC